MSVLRVRRWLAAGLTALVLAAVAPALAQQAPAASAEPPQAAPGAPQQRRGGARPQTPALGDGPWDFATEREQIRVTVVTKGLQSPWGMAFLPNGDLLVTERPGRLRVVRGGVLDPTP